MRLFGCTSKTNSICKRYRTLTKKGGAAPRGGAASKGGGATLDPHAQGLQLGQPSVFRTLILQHHDEVELSCMVPRN
jgi:hypothetical protein